MKIRDPFDESIEYPELTSLIDVMFLLLIFFLLTTSFEHEKTRNIIEMKLPLAQHSHPLVKNEAVCVGIDANGNYTIENKQFDKQHVFEELKARVNNSHDSTVVINGDGTAPYQAVVFVYDMLQVLGVKHFSHQVQ